MNRAAVLILGFLLPSVLTAAEPTSAHRKAIKAAEELGRDIYLQDMAAASASDALLASTSPEARAGVMGWIVTVPEDMPLVQFVAKQDEVYVTRFDVKLPRGETPDVRQVVPPREIHGDDLAMFLARQVAVAAIPAGACSKSFNTVVLPNDGGKKQGWLVYLLAATTEENKVLIGGHYRARVSADGVKLLSFEPLSNTCLSLSTASQGGGTVKALFMSQVLTDTPIETHVYLNLLHKIDFYVMTEPGVWSIRNGSIRYAGPRPDAGQK